MYICFAQCKNPYNAGIVQGKVGIPILSTDSGIVLDNSGIAQGTYRIMTGYGLCIRVYKVGILKCNIDLFCSYVTDFETDICFFDDRYKTRLSSTFSSFIFYSIIDPFKKNGN